MALAGLALFALTLLASAWLKAVSPGPAAHALAWTGLRFSSRVLLIDGWTVVEAVLGGALLILFAHRAVLWGGLLAALALSVLHGVGWALGSGDCGCFGDVAIPDGVTMALLLFGVWSAAVLLRHRGAVRSRLGWPRLAGVVLIAVCGALPLWNRKTPKGRPEALLLEQVADAAPDSLLVIGSKDCGHCLESMQEIAAERKSSPALQAVPVRFVIRDTDVGSGVGLRAFPWAKIVPVPEDLWWRLLLQGPPTFLRVRGGVPQGLSETWRE